MKNGCWERAAAIVLAVILSCSCTVEAKAAAGSRIRLFGIHDARVGLHHTMYRCWWMESVERQYQEADVAADVVKRHYARAKSVYASMKASDYLIIMTHGDKTGIGVYDKAGDELEKSRLLVSEIENGAELNNLKVCFIAACNSADMAEAMYKKGARSAIGFPAEIDAFYAAELIKKFN